MVHLCQIKLLRGKRSHRITRPLNADLFIESEIQFKQAFERFIMFLADLKRFHNNAIDQPGGKEYSEIVGSVKTTSKDRIDKIFLDKHLLVKLLGREIPVIAIFLHDVQRAIKGNTIFGINSTFKTNHFLGYTVALNKLDGVYYVDPRPEMMVNDRLRQQIRDFQQLLIEDLWAFSHS
jgi:hypothetical protein